MELLFVVQHLCLYFRDQKICNGFLAIPTLLFSNNLIKLSINRMWWKEKCWSVLSSTTLLAKSKEKLIHAPFMLLNSLPWTDAGWIQALVISLFLLGVIPKTPGSLQQSVQGKFFFHGCGICWIHCNLLEIGWLRCPCFFHLSELHQAGCRASPGLFQMKLWPHLSLNFTSYSFHIQNLVVWGFFCLFFLNHGIVWVGRDL